MPHSDPFAALLSGVRRIALVGASPRPDRPSHRVLVALVARGYEVVPVTPVADEVAGLATVPDLAALDGPVDLVDVFRRAEEAPAVAREAAAIGAPALWLQLGIRSDEARAIAEAAGMAYVEDACVAVEVARLGLRPG